MLKNVKKMLNFFVALNLSIILTNMSLIFATKENYEMLVKQKNEETLNIKYEDFLREKFESAPLENYENEKIHLGKSKIKGGFVRGTRKLIRKNKKSLKKMIAVLISAVIGLINSGLTSAKKKKINVNSKLILNKNLRNKFQKWNTNFNLKNINRSEKVHEKK